jgi:hypothetical protein
VSVKFVAIINRLKNDRIIKEIERKPLRDIYTELGAAFDVGQVRFMIGDEVVTDLNRIPADGDEVIIKVVPGSTGPKEQQGALGKLGGSALIFLGIIVGLSFGWTGSERWSRPQ